jgi:hypothetical protein
MTDDKSKTPLKIGSAEIKPIRPEPITQDIEVVPYKKRMGPAYALEALLEGYSVLITDFYSAGLEILNEISKYIRLQHPDQSFPGKRAARAAYQELSNRVFLKINSHKLLVRKAPEIGWIKILYPDFQQFLLSFPQVQGLNSSWQWYKNGLYIPVLHKKIYPWYGTYFPTRFEHLELFGNWLKQYKGDKNQAIDVGIGSGVLAMQMLNHGFSNVCGTDTNPNAIIGLDDYIVSNQIQQKLTVIQGDLFDNCPKAADVIVFNPPWLPADGASDGLDAAIYYPDTLFPRFFDEAAKYLKSQGRLVILFSNLAEISEIGSVHPIISELEKENRFSKVQLMTKQVRAASSKTKRELSIRRQEKVELWELKLNNLSD